MTHPLYLSFLRELVIKAMSPQVRILMCLGGLTQSLDYKLDSVSLLLKVNTTTRLKKMFNYSYLDVDKYFFVSNLIRLLNIVVIKMFHLIQTGFLQ